VQTAPGIFFGAQTPESHQAVAAHSVSPAHPVRQAVAPHAYVPQAFCCTAGHDPVPAHEAASVSVPAWHDALRHAVEAPG